jgi:hypothetical protein
MEYGIFLPISEINDFVQIYPFSQSNIIQTIPENVLEITSHDLLFPYKQSNDHIMMLSYEVDDSFYQEVKERSTCIGRVFSVPIKDKLCYSTFEIPDFIVYQHETHTNYTIDGINPDCKRISQSIVCLNTKVSPVAYEFEYYETNVIIYSYVPQVDNNPSSVFFTNIYMDYMMNMIVNKEKKYAILWYPKCGCTTITNLFCQVNGIELEESKPNRSLNFFLPEYRYNAYLQNIEVISFVRNPYDRFLSSYIDKHIHKSDPIYIELDGFLEYRKKYSNDCMFNLCAYLFDGGYISDHYRLMSHYNNRFTYYPKIKITFYKIEENLNENLYQFMRTFHPSIDRKVFTERYDNSICQQFNSPGKMNELNNNIQHFDEHQWKIYLDKFNINYKLIIEGDYELKHKLYMLFEADFIAFCYEK